MARSNLADEVLYSMVEAYNRDPEGRFVLAKAISGRGKYRVSHPGGSIGVDALLIDDLIARKLVTVTAREPGFKILTITLRGFDFAAHMSRAGERPGK